MTMRAILSTTCDDMYLFNLPFAVYSWARLGIPTHLFWTRAHDAHQEAARVLAFRYAERFNPWDEHPFMTTYIHAPEEKEATYAQCARLYAASMYNDTPDDEILITSDIDMCVFNKEAWEIKLRDGEMVVLGSDLVEGDQVPICYIAGTKKTWQHVMKIYGMSTQECLDDLLKPIKAKNFRGNYWCKDQETAYKHLRSYREDGGRVRLIPRAFSETHRIATHRADRDGWPDPIPLDIIDAHLPRPGWTAENFPKIYRLFRTMYPKEVQTWMVEYLNEFTDIIRWKERSSNGNA